VINARYLELSTDQAMKESAKEAAKLFQEEGGCGQRSHDALIPESPSHLIT